MEGNVTDLLIAIGQQRPHGPAIHVPGRGTLTYGALAAHAGYVQRQLESWGCARGDVVAGFSAARPQMAVAIATLPSACTFAPLPPTLSRELCVETLARTRAAAVVVDAGVDHALRAAAQDLGIGVLEVRSDAAAGPGLFELALHRPPLRAGPAARTTADHCYVIASSGTTGRRKLVPLGHRQLIVYARAIADRLALGGDDTGVHVMPMHFGHGLNAALMNALLAGRSIVCLPEADVPAFFEAIEEFRPTYLTASFAVFREIARRAPDFPDAVARSRLRFMRSGSGHLARDTAERLEQLFAAPMLNGLATTESGRIALDPLPPGVRKRGAAGLPLLNDVAILDREGQVMPAGAQGEIVTRGPTLFDGYLDDPELTAASFVGGWFRTGDLGRIDDDGYLHVLGRCGEVINRGGEKISPVEIDLAIEELAGVREAAAYAVPHPSLGEEIVAAVVPAQDGGADAAAIAEHVRARLGGARVPRRIHFLPELPRTGNGKLRRAEVAAAVLRAGSTDAPARAPAIRRSRPPVEVALTALWSAILDVDRIGPDDDFFLLGGDSMSGGQLLSHVHAVFGVLLPMTQLFGPCATVAGMAEAVDAARLRQALPGIGAGDEPPSAPAFLARHRDGPAPLSLPQQRLWFVARYDPEGAAYNTATAHALAGDLDVDALRRALQAVIARHAILRSTFALTEAGPRQLAGYDTSPDFSVIDLSAMPAAQQDSALADAMAACIDEPFDLARGPLLRARVFRLAGERHVLLRVLHHIITDQWSAAILSRDLAAGYRQARAGHAASLPALRVQYADFAHWQQDRIAAGELDRQIDFWKARLQRLVPIELPADRPRPPVQSYRGAHLTVELSPQIVRGLEAVAGRARATLFMAAFATFNVLLHRWTGSTDIAVGTSVAGRRRPEVEELIGFFLNTLVLRTDLTGDPTFADTLARVRDGTIEALDNQDLPFERLVEELAPPRDPSRNPLFQVSFAFWNEHESALDLDGVEATRIELPARAAKFDLSLILRRNAGGMTATWEYSADLFDAPTIARLAACFGTLAHAVAAQPLQRIGSLPLLSDAERHRILVEWNATAAAYPREATVHALVARQAARTPHAIAVVHEGAELTYGELEHRAGQVALHLAERGVRRGDLVGVCLTRTPLLVVALLGVLKAGAAFLPLDPDLPCERLAFMVEDAGATFVLVEAATAYGLSPAGVAMIPLDRDLPAPTSPRGAGFDAGAGAADLAYVIYTSGSTGKPKGVEVAHGAVVNLLWATRERPGCTEHDRVLALATIAFDAAVNDLFLPLIVGARVEIASRESARDGRLLRQAFERSRPTLVLATPSTWRMLIDTGWQGANDLVAQCGGEPLPRDLADQLLARTAALWNLYGPTEATVTCCAEKLAPDGRAITIGRPLANTQAYILDARLQPVPVGVPGELYIAGDGLARGYRNRPQLTAERFLAHACSAQPGARMYRTGDRARWTDDGRIDLLGRIDRQVKLRGQRIELGEIEATLREHPDVGDCAVVVCDAETTAAHLAACVVAPAGANVDNASLRRWLARWLPAYMLPSRIVTMERLPLTTSGKVDYQSLPPPREEDSGARGPADDDPVVAGVVDVWRAILRIADIDPEDDFFLLGGHSLLAATVTSRLSAAFAIDLPLRSIFETPTVAGLSATIAQLTARDAAQEGSPLVPRRPGYRPPPTGTSAPVT